MPIIKSWYNDEETILLETFEGAWDLNDYFNLVDEASAMLKSKPHQVHIICDFTETKLPPHQVMTGARYAERRLPPNQGVTVFVQPGAVISTFIKVAKQMGFRATDHLYVADTIEAALEIIHAKSTELKQQA